jgi:mono/diheme cytochrome c family protein
MCRATSGLAMVVMACWLITAGAADVERGHATYQFWCEGCHGKQSPFSIYHGPPSGTLMLQRLYDGKEPAVLSERTDLSAELIKFTVRHGRNFMPLFRKTEVSDAQLEDIAAYLTRNNAK